MAKVIWDYPITDVYGYSKNYFNYTRFHTGVDRVAPKGTSITVNGVKIGEVGTTGLSTGNHLHVGKYLYGKSFNPGSGGKVLSNAKVTQVAEDSVNGKYVRVQSGLYSWVYLHMSKQTAKVGQKLVAPKSAYPKWVTVKSGWGANVRKKPTTASPLSGSRFLPRGTRFRVAGIVKGQSIAGNSKWYKSMYGNYVWSGNIK